MDYPMLIKKLREKLVVSQTELAEILGYAFASANRWENGVQEPTFKMKRKMLALGKKHGIAVEE